MARQRRAFGGGPDGSFDTGFGAVTRRDRRALVFGAALVTIAAGARVLSTAAAKVRGTEDSVAAGTDLLRRAHRELAREDVLLDSLRFVEAALPRVARLVLPGDTTADVQRELARRVTMTITDHQARGGKVEAVTDTTHVNGLAHARVVAAWESDIRGVVDVLLALERDSAIVVHSVEITAVDSHAPPVQPEVLEVRTEIGGWYLRRSAADRLAGVSGFPRDSVDP